MTPQARQLIKNLNENEPYWQEVLEEIGKRSVPAFKPTDTPLEVQSSKWIYQSGRQAERDRVLTLLKGNANHD